MPKNEAFTLQNVSLREKKGRRIIRPHRSRGDERHMEVENDEASYGSKGLPANVQAGGAPHELRGEASQGQMALSALPGLLYFWF